MTTTTMYKGDNKALSERIVRKTRQGMITHVTFSENNEVKSEYRLFDNRGAFLQTIKTPFRVADYL